MISPGRRIKYGRVAYQSPGLEPLTKGLVAVIQNIPLADVNCSIRLDNHQGPFDIHDPFKVNYDKLDVSGRVALAKFETVILQVLEKGNTNGNMPRGIQDIPFKIECREKNNLNYISLYTEAHGAFKDAVHCSFTLKQKPLASPRENLSLYHSRN